MRRGKRRQLSAGTGTPRGDAGRFAVYIRRAIEASGVTRARLCRAAGIEEAAMSRFCRGLSGLTLASVERLADVLGLDLVQRGPIKLGPAIKRGRAKTKGTKSCATRGSVG